LLVEEQCKVEFQIGRYKDKVVCDIMPMDVCHILLGRPWQYNRKVVHDGLTNCYKFVKDGIKHTLVPIKEEGTTGKSEPKALLVSGKQFLKQVEDSEMGYAVCKESKDNVVAYGGIKFTYRNPTDVAGVYRYSGG